MARIRIVAQWLRSPISPPTQARAIMVIAEKWAEQRVLMRAFAACHDQTRPTIVLHGAELAIGPAGTDPHGEWGIHVQPPEDGRAQELRQQLELAARRLAGSKGNPPRLQDEGSAFETKATNNWAPGTGRDRQTPAPLAAVATDAPAPAQAPAPAGANQAADAAHAAHAAHAPRAPRGDRSTVLERSTPGSHPPASPSSSPISRHTPTHFAARPPSSAGKPSRKARTTQRRRGWTSPLPTGGAALDRAERALPTAGASANRTALGFALAGAPAARPAPAPYRPAPRGLASAVGATMPLGFRLGDDERSVLNALGRAQALSAREVAEIVGVSNGMEWMERFMSRLSEHGLDLVAPGDDRDGEPTYVLRR